MNRLDIRPVICGALIATALWLVLIGPDASTAGGPPILGVDANPAGNTATSLGPIESCQPVELNETFDIDLYVKDVDELLAWELWFVYDKEILNVTAVDVELFQDADPNSNVFDASEAVPDSDGIFVPAAVDLGQDSANSGSGVLARLTLRAVGPGISDASLPQLDLNQDGQADAGSMLTNKDLGHIGDVTGDGLFDGPIFHAQIAVDTPCPAAGPIPSLPPSPTPSPIPQAEAEDSNTPTPTSTPSRSDGAHRIAESTPGAGGFPFSGGTPAFGGSSVWILGSLLGLALGAGLAFFAWTRRRRREPD